MDIERDTMEYDVLVVGGGPGGLACAIKLKEMKPELNICVLEKASAIGAQALSGAVLEPGPLDALLPGWRDAPPGVCIPAKRDEFALLTRTGRIRMPVPPQQHNDGNFIVSLGLLTPLLAARAEALGVDVFPGFAAAQPLFNDDGSVAGVQIGDVGIERSGEPGPNFALDADCDPQTYGLGFKELWQLPPGRVEPGLIQHSIGWPLDSGTYGGSFLYHLDKDRVYVGYVVGLDYRDPRLKPFEAFQQFKHHPSIKPLLEGGEILASGARTIAAGGWQSLPKMEMPGAMLVGDAAGTLNVAKIKGIHQAIRCGMLAAEHLAEHGSPAGFDARWRASEGGQELRKVRNIKPGFKRGLWFALANAGLETLLGGRTPWTLRNKAAYAETQRLDSFESPDRGWSDRTLPPRDRVAAVFFANNSHDENQPVHLKVRDTSICATKCATEYGNPCQNFCPANVYEMVDDGAGGKRLQINASNCVHCKACDIKDPYQIIDWTTPEGGSGPIYQSL
jgi:electron-transferring-flavoprotein dehydrogenase